LLSFQDSVCTRLAATKFTEAELLADLSLESSGEELLATNLNNELNY
jgi:hypothetical protein